MVKSLFSKKLIRIKTERLRDEIFGATDGTISTLAVIAGVYGATANNFLIIIVGLSAMFAEAVSMGFASYSGALIRGKLKEVHKPFSEGITFWLATMAGGFIPIIPFILPNIAHFAVSVLFSALFLFAIGAHAARIIREDILLTGTRTAMLGLVAAAVTYFIGTIFAQIIPV
jgi:VIT1/CCC1 family predicted Fe2+/Mn2+ transporter